MNKPRALLAVTYWSLEEGLIQAYTLPYLRLILQAMPAGSTIHLVAWEKDPAPLEPAQRGSGTVHHPFRYAPFGMRGAAMALRVVARLLRLARKERIDGIHAWCTPAGSLGLMLSWLLRRPLVIDSYEPHADAMVENGTWPRGGAAHRILLKLERWQSRRAAHLIACAEGMSAYAHARYGLPAERRIDVKPACVDLDRFAWPSVKDAALLDELGLEGRIVAVYAGKFGGIYLEEESFGLLRAAIRAGLSPGAVYRGLAENGPEGLRREFATLVAETRIAGPVAALESFRERLADPLADDVVQALILSDELGGRTLGPVLDHLAAATRAELGVLNELRAHQTRTVTQARFLAALPVLVLAAVRAVAPEYLGVFDGPGQLGLAACGLSVAVGYALMTRLTRVVGDERPFG